MKRPRSFSLVSVKTILPRVLFVFAALWVLACGSYLAAASPEARIRAIFGQYNIKDHMIGVVLADQATGQVLVDIHGSEQKIPASTAKLFTTAAALHTLGPDFAFQTRLYGKGDAVLLEGRGDPNLSGRLHNDDALVPFRTMIQDAKKQGLAQNLETLLIDDRYFDDVWTHPDWPAQQHARWYCAQVGALSFNDNCLLIKVASRPRTGLAAQFSCLPPTGYANITNQCLITDKHKKHSIAFARTLGTNQIKISGRFWIKAKPYKAWVTIHDPGMFSGAVFKETFAREGISLKNPVRRVGRDEAFDKREQLAEWRSDLKETIRICNKRSQNFYAEQIFKTLGAEQFNIGTFSTGARAVSESLQDLGVSLDLFVIQDGSGLAASNRAAPMGIVQLLLAMSRHSQSRTFIQSLPTNGEPETTLRSRMKDSEKEKIHAKSGHINKVNCLAGYLETPDGHTLVFAIMVNGFTVPSYKVNQALDRICATFVKNGCPVPDFGGKP